MQIVPVQWRAWFGDTILNLTFPDLWQVRRFDMHDSPALSPHKIVDALVHPIEGSPLDDLAKRARHAVIAVDDLSRPTPASEILPSVLDILEGAGVARDRTRILISLGSHTRLRPDELRRKLGDEVVTRYAVANHDCHDDLVDVGVKVGDVPVSINRWFAEADLRILLGSVVPHPFAGFSGGAKMVLPGLANIESIEWTHRAVMRGLRGTAGILAENHFRIEFERVARHVGVHFGINAVVNGRREIAGLFSGDLTAAHREAAKFARTVYGTPLAGEALDVAVLNAYPKDDELLQAETAFVLHQTAPAGYLKQDGVVVLVSACSLGMGHHGLFGPGQRLYRRPLRRGFLGNRALVAFMPGVTREEFHSVFWTGYQHFGTWEGVLAFLGERYAEGATVGVFPCSSLQIAQ